jgi:hypothetical protein
MMSAERELVAVFLLLGAIVGLGLVGWVPVRPPVRADVTQLPAGGPGDPAGVITEEQAVALAVAHLGGPEVLRGRNEWCSTFDPRVSRFTCGKRDLARLDDPWVRVRDATGLAGEPDPVVGYKVVVQHPERGTTMICVSDRGRVVLVVCRPEQ